ncbi:MAG: carboxypeptidase M32, partial [Gaiellaceae bacterium]
MTEPAAFTDLKERLASIGDLAGVSQLLYWDQRTKMPVGGSEGRAEQIATVGRIAHELFVDPEVGRLLDACESWADGLEPDSFEASFVRVTRRDWEKATCVPPQLTAEMRRAGALALRAWAEARAASDFAKLAPHLERNLQLKHRYVACFPEADEAYDILLDDYEPGMRTAEVRAVFDDLKAELLPLIRAVGNTEAEPELELPREGQERFAREVLDRLGFDEETWRLDETAHPFMASPGAGDIRLTTRWESGLNWLFGAIHEFGHGVYEHDIDPALARTPLAGGVSLGIHESQSRMWENLVGRSRPFWHYFFPRLQDAFPQEFGTVDLDSFYRATNRVEPSFIRVDADEVTYNLHI